MIDTLCLTNSLVFLSAPTVENLAETIFVTVFGRAKHADLDNLASAYGAL